MGIHVHVWHTMIHVCFFCCSPVAESPGMPLIEGIGDEVTVTVGLIFVFLFLLLAWASTNVAYQPFTVIVLDRRSLQAIVQRIRQQATGAAAQNGQAGSGGGRLPGTAAQNDEEEEDDNHDNAEEEEENKEPAEGAGEASGQGGDTKDDAEDDSSAIESGEPSSSEHVDANVSNAEDGSTVNSSEVLQETVSSDIHDISGDASQATGACRVTDLSETELRQRRLAFFTGQRPERTSTTGESDINTSNVEGPNTSSVDVSTSSGLRQTDTEPNQGEGPSDQTDNDTGEGNEQDAYPSTENIENIDRIEGHIRIRLKYLDERQRLVQAKPEDTIGDFKR